MILENPIDDEMSAPSARGILVRHQEYERRRLTGLKRELEILASNVSEARTAYETAALQEHHCRMAIAAADRALASGFLDDERFVQTPNEMLSIKAALEGAA